MAQLLFSYREGNRSEYLAQFILSAIGTCVPVPRTEDIGVDFHCTVAKRDGMLLSFKSPYLVQIKSESEDKIVYGWHPLKKKGTEGKWKPEELDWLFSQENPVLVGLVDKEQLRIKLYSTSNIWSVFYRQRYPGQLVLIPDAPGSATEDVPASQPVPCTDWPPKTGDGHIWEVKLGPPILSLTPQDVQDEEKLNRYRQVLELAIKTDQRNLWYRGLGVPYFNWILKVDTNRGQATAFYHGVSDVLDSAKAQLREASPILASLILHYSAQNNMEQMVRAFEGIYPLIREYQHEVMIKALEAAFAKAAKKP
jgi:hypothetical protein